MIESLVNTVLGKLADEVFKKFTQIREVGEKVNKLKRELGRLQAFLKDADREKIKNERQMHWVKELINVAYDIEDVIDNALLLEVVPQENTSKTKAFLSKFKKPHKLPAVSKLCDDLDEILARIDEISNSREKYGINNLGEGIGEETMLPPKPIMIADIDDPNVVGFESHAESIVEELLDQNNQSRSVVSIVGIGGLGKTTLARKVYNRTEVKANFDLRLWVVVSKNFELIDTVKKILEQIRPIQSSEKRKEIQHFLTEIHRSLGDRKYFLVLDDVWTAELWDHIEEALVDTNNGSRVLITSRDENVGRAANSSLDPFRLPFLSDEQGLQLLLKKAHYNPHLTNNALSHGLLDIARKLVKKCGGLPLALMVLGGLLSRNPHEHTVWSKFLQTMNWSTDASRCVDIIATSYDDLPLALKFCFMYLAAFPEDSEINAPELTRMWVAEGFIPQEKNKTLEDTAQSYLDDLAQRSMVQVSHRSYDDSIERFRVHDLLRDLAVEKAKEVNFLRVCSKADEQQSCCEARRLAVHYSDCDELMKYAHPNLRTLICFNSEPPNCSGHKLLKVLSDIRYWHVPETRTNIEGLTQLRYLKLRGYTYINNKARFEKLINNMRFLQTLNFKGIKLDDAISDFIWNIETLRHVILPLWSRQPISFGRLTSGPPSGSNLRNLQSLIGIRYRGSWETTSLPNLSNLRSLDIQITQESSCNVVVAFLCTLKSLIELCLTWDKKENIPLDVFDMRCFPFYQQLTSLSLGCKIYHVTEVTIDAAMFPIHLTKLCLKKCILPHDPMAVLEKLYNLKHLYLSYAIGESTRKIRCSAKGFPHLQVLSIYVAQKLEEWEIEEGAMPMLRELHIVRCPMLRVPLELQCLTTLCKLRWGLSGDNSPTTKAQQIRNLCKHVPHINIEEP